MASIISHIKEREKAIAFSLSKIEHQRDKSTPEMIKNPAEDLSFHLKS